MEIKEYEQFCEKHGNFMQSALWADVKQNWEHEFITCKNQNGDISGVMLVLIKRIPFTGASFIYAPRGPVCDYHDRNTLDKLFAGLLEIAKRYHGYAVKIDPLIDMADFAAIENLKSFGFIHHPEKIGYDNVQCRENYLLDIRGKTAEEVFNSFKPKHRYNIRLAQRRGVECGFYGTERLDDFMKLMKMTAERDGFNMRDKAYFERLIKSFKSKAGLCMCCYDGEPLSGALYIEYGDTVSYVYGCSSDSFRKLMPNYLMQWSMIKRACDRGLDTYDFCGIPYYYDETHKNYGVYKFKKGFNGKVKVYAGEFDLILRPVVSSCADIVKKLICV